MKKHLLTLLLLIGLEVSLALTGGELLNKIDENFTALNQISESTMVIHGLRHSRSIKSRSWSSEHGEKAFTEYLEPAREKGTKMLKLKDDLWIYSPAADRIIKIAGHMLRQSVSGSDLSYEDYLEDDDLSAAYTATILGEEIFQKRSCYILQLVAKKEGLAYHSRKLWIDTETYLPLKGERFGKSGKLLKRTIIEETMRVGVRWYPKRMTYKDMLKKGKGTEFIINKIEFNTDIPMYRFSKASLRR
jgi:outer membrane lipoprotein-sorting protein